MSPINTISVIGTGYSGSGAVLDYFRSTPTIYFPLKDVEYLLPHCPGGLLSLSAEVFQNKNASTSSVCDSVERFFKATELLYRSNGIFLKGMNYKKLLPNFLDDIEFLIDQCFVKDYSVDIYFDWLQKTPLERVKARLLSDHRVCFSPVEGLDFKAVVRKFHERLFRENSHDLIVLNQSLNYLSIDATRDFFANHKIIVVTRNPFDQYADLKLKKNFRGLEKFVWMYSKIKSRIEAYSSSPDILHVKFEDLVLDFEGTTTSIKRFIDFDVRASTQNFDPRKSRENVNFYKKVLSTEEIDCLFDHFGQDYD